MAESIYHDDNTEGRRGPANKHHPVAPLRRKRSVDYRGTDKYSRMTRVPGPPINEDLHQNTSSVESNQVQHQPSQNAPQINQQQQVPIDNYRENERNTHNRYGESPKVAHEKSRNTHGRQGIKEYSPLGPLPRPASFPYPYPTISNEKLLRASAELLAPVVTFRPKDYRGRRFDKRYWIEGETRDKTDLLALKPLKPDRKELTPSFAIREIFANPGLWNFDCSEFAQVILLNTLRQMIGDTEFDTLPRDHDDAFRIRRQWSTFLRGSSIKLAWDTIDGKFTRIRGLDKYEPETKSPEEILRHAPIGSLVNFRNFDPGVASTDEKQNAFETENVVKIGQDEFIAFGFGDAKPYYSSKQIMTALAKNAVHGRKIPKGYMEKYIRISGVIPFALPEIKKQP